MSEDQNANLPTPIEEYRHEDWLTAAETLRLVIDATLSRRSNITICKRAHAGLIRARADLITIGQESREDELIHREFWWAEGHDALIQNWKTGDFETWMDKRFHVRAFGVRFHRADVQRMVPAAFGTAQPAAEPKNAGGRSMSRLWPEWVAEIVAYFHEEGLPPGTSTKGSDALIEAIEERLQERGTDSPSRSTVQETVKAVLRRMREN